MSASFASRKQFVASSTARCAAADMRERTQKKHGPNRFDFAFDVHLAQKVFVGNFPALADGIPLVQASPEFGAIFQIFPDRSDFLPYGLWNDRIMPASKTVNTASQAGDQSCGISFRIASGRIDPREKMNNNGFWRRAGPNAVDRLHPVAGNYGPRSRRGAKNCLPGQIEAYCLCQSVAYHINPVARKTEQGNFEIEVASSFVDGDDYRLRNAVAPLKSQLLAKKHVKSALRSPRAGFAVDSALRCTFLQDIP